MYTAKKLATWAMGLTMATLVHTGIACAQTAPSAYEPPQSLWLGAEYGNLQAGFPSGSSVRMSGIGVFATYNWNKHYALEGHARFLNFYSWYGETQQNYLIGPRYTFLRNNKWRPFARFQVGVVHIQYPFEMGTGNSLALAPAGGVEYRVNHKWSVNGTYEYQFLPNSPNFTGEPKFGIRPNGVTAGISYRLF